MKKVKGKILVVIGVLAVLGIYYYAALPAFNIHSMEFWILLIGPAGTGSRNLWKNCKSKAE